MKDSSDVIGQFVVQFRNRIRKVLAWSETSTSRIPEIAVLVAIAGIVLYWTRNSWFFGDDWAFLINRHELWNSGQRFDAIFFPHNEHLSAVPAVLYLLLENVFGIGSTLPFFAILIAGHVAVLWAIRTIMVRLEVPMIWRIIGLVWLGLFGAGAENLVWPFQLSFIWAFAFAIWGLLVITGGEGQNLRRDFGASALLTLGLFTASTALSVTVVAAVVLLASSRSLVRFLRIFLAPLGLYATWYLFYGASRVPHNPFSITKVIPFFTRVISFGFDQTFQIPTLGLALGVAALILISSLNWFTRQQWQISLVLATILFVFYALSAFGRSYLGDGGAVASRYVYFCGAMSIPFIVVASLTLLKRVPKLLPIVAVVLGIAIFGNIGVFLDIRNDHLASTSESKWRYAVAGAHVMSPLVDLSYVPDVAFNPQVSLAGIRSLREAGIWSTDVPLSPQQLLEGSLQFGTRLYTTTPDASSQSYKAVVSSVDGATLTMNSAGCLVAHPTGSSASLVLEPRSVGVFSIDTGGAPSAIRLQLEDPPAVRTESRDLRTTGVNAPLWIGVYPVFGQPVIELPSDTDTTLCGLVGG